MDWINFVLAVAAGLIVCVPLVVALVKFVKRSATAEHWDELVKLIFGLCQSAEVAFMSGADRKQWVMTMVEGLASSIDYTLQDGDLDKISDLIDAFIAATKLINVSSSTEPDFSAELELDEN